MTEKNRRYSGVIAAVHRDGIAAEIGLAVGDKILEVNGRPLRDIIDLSFALAEEEIELLVEKGAGERELIEFDKEYDEDLGVEFASAVFDGIRRCGNKCCFCFVDQIAPGMRPSLSVKDDDYRMSFLYGNFVTLTNMREEDFARIQRLHLSPLFISVHATDGALREKLIGSRRGGEIMAQLNRLRQMDVEFHLQIVLCPGLNDGAALEKTVADLAALQPHALSLAIVPVGLTRYRDKCYPLRKFTGAEAAAVVAQARVWQREQREKYGRAFVYLGDEFYFLAGQAVPESAAYDGFPQLENGVGITRDFIDEWKDADLDDTGYETAVHLDIVCGKSAAEILEPLVEELRVANLHARVVAVENRFFGADITVTGLLTGRDILQALRSAGGRRDGVIVPGAALRAGEEVFLDDVSLEELRQSLDVEMRTARGGAELKSLLSGWHAAPDAAAAQRAYTWQGNAGYTKRERQ